jgi:hypothetical protein
MNKSVSHVILSSILCLLGFSQQTKHEDSEEILRLADITANNIETAIGAHLGESDFQLKKQQPELQLRCFDILVFKNGSIKLDWTTGQHARCRMENLRQGIHALQSADHPRGLDAIALPSAKSLWPRLRNIVCYEYPGVQYYDLDGFEQYCPEAAATTSSQQRPK